MNVIWKAACAAALIAATFIEIGCGDVYRPIAVPTPTVTGNPSGAETEVALSCCMSPASPNAGSPLPSSIVTGINVSGDTNAGNKLLNNIVGQTNPGVGPSNPITASSSPASILAPITPSSNPLAFDYSRTVVFTANTYTDSVTQSSLNASTSGFAATTSTLALEPGSAPIGISFQYYGTTYTQDYVVNSGPGTTCPGTGSLGAIVQSSLLLKATVCVGASPVEAWIYRDQSKVFVLDKTENQVYVVSATKYEVTNKIPVGKGPIKAAQSNDGQYIYVLNSVDNSISVIDGQAETVVATVPLHLTSPAGADALTNSPPIDIAQDTNFNDITANTQINHIWILHNNGTVSVWDGTNVAVSPNTLTWITSLSTITTAQAALTTPATPTNLALMRDGTQAYVGVGGTDQIVAIDTSKLAIPGTITLGVNPCPANVPCSQISATTSITVGVHRNVTQAFGANTVPLEVTTPVVSQVAVSRGGNTADLSKAYANTTTTTTYFYYDANGNLLSSATYPNLYNGTAVVTAASNGATPINTYVTTILSPSVVTYCVTGNPATGEYDGQKNCPAMVPNVVLGRS
jgi:YVTN family beta-propeller protein